MQNNYSGKLVDMVAPLELQAKLDPKLEISDIKLSISQQISKKECPVEKTEFLEFEGVEKRILDKNFRLREGVVTTQKEFMEHVKEIFGKETTASIIKRRNIVQTIKGKLANIKGMDGQEEVIISQVSRGNFTNMIKNSFNFNFLANTAEIAREHLTPQKWINESNEYLLGKLRSNLVTVNVLDANGDILSDLDAIHEASKIIADKWNKDIAMSSLYTFHEMGGYEGTIYHLEKQDVDVVL